MCAATVRCSVDNERWCRMEHLHGAGRLPPLAVGRGRSATTLSSECMCTMCMGMGMGMGIGMGVHVCCVLACLRTCVCYGLRRVGHTYGTYVCAPQVLFVCVPQVRSEKCCLREKRYSFTAL